MLVELAYATCIAAHAGQKRKFTGDPYHTHPIAVSELVKHFGGNDTVIAAALLHDVVEDTKVTFKDLELIFPPEVFSLVYQLTKKPGVDYTTQLCNAGEFVQFIKLCDILDNCKDSPNINYVRSKIEQIQNFKHSEIKLFTLKRLLEHELRLSMLRSTPGSP